jgi:hypothetical protein
MPKKPTLYTPTGQCCELDEPYQAPVGYFDQPFVYVYDADALPDNQERRFANIKTFTGADFILRRVGGIDRVCTNFQLRDVLARQIFNSPVNSAFHDFPLLPEVLYPAGDGISFDLLPVVKTLKVNGGFNVPLSQIVFQGVRRFKGYRRPPSYPYWEDEFSYILDITIDWPASDTNPRRFSIDIFDNDFELLQITEVIEESGEPGFNTACKIQLYDQVNEPVFSAPVIDDLIVDNSTDYQGIVPVPGIVYRIGQQIRLDIISLVLAPDVPQVVHFWFHGVRRRPC